MILQIVETATKNTISVMLELESSNAKLYAVHLEDINFSNMAYEGYSNLIQRVVERLKDFEIWAHKTFLTK